MNSKSNYLPGDFAMWIFIFAELTVFAIFFLAYAFSRSQHVELFNQYQLTLNKESGAINTFILITSSYFVVQAVKMVKQDQIKKAGNWLMAALLGGMGFVIIKMAEFISKTIDGINLSTNLFYMFYLSLTFFHFMHVLLGMVILFIIWLNLRKGLYSSQQFIGIETGAVYWHMVDLVWIVLFPLVYIIR